MARPMPRPAPVTKATLARVDGMPFPNKTGSIQYGNLSDKRKTGVRRIRMLRSEIRRSGDGHAAASPDEQPLDLGGGQGLAEQKPLHFGAAFRRNAVELFAGFDA